MMPLEFTCLDRWTLGGLPMAATYAAETRVDTHVK